MLAQLSLAALALASSVPAAAMPPAAPSETIIIVNAIVRQRIGTGITSGPFVNWNFGDPVKFIGGVNRPNPGGSTVGNRLAVLDYDTLFCSVGSAFVNLSTDATNDNITIGNDTVSNGSSPFDLVLGTYILIDQTTGMNAGFAGIGIIDESASIFQTNDISQLSGLHTTPSTPAWTIVIGDPLLFGSGIRCRIQSIEIIQSASVGSTFCASAIPNSTGVPGELAAIGFDLLDANDLELRATQLPLGQFGVLLSARQQMPPITLGGNGAQLCLGGTVGRHLDQIKRVGTSAVAPGVGVAQFFPNLDRIPSGNGFVPAMVGETWSFQVWHRDIVGGVAGSNVTAGAAVTLQ